MDGALMTLQLILPNADHLSAVMQHLLQMMDAKQLLKDLLVLQMD